MGQKEENNEPIEVFAEVMVCCFAMCFADLFGSAIDRDLNGEALRLITQVGSGVVRPDGVQVHQIPTAESRKEARDDIFSGLTGVIFPALGVPFQTLLHDGDPENNVVKNFGAVEDGAHLFGTAANRTAVT